MTNDSNRNLEVTKEVSITKTYGLLQSCIDSQKDIVVWSIDEKYNYLYFNETHKKVMKKIYNQDIEVGKNILLYIEDLDERNKVKKNHNLALSGKLHAINEEYGNIQKQYFKTSFSPIYGDADEIVGVAGIARDTTEIVNKEKELRYEKELAQTYLDLAGTIILVLNNKGDILLMNKKGCSILEMNEEDIIGLNWFERFLPTEQIDDVKEVFRKVFLKETELVKHYENNILTSSNELRVIKWENNILCGSDGEITGVISSGEDVTEIRKKENELIHFGYYDQLTNLTNRRFFDEQMKRLDNPRSLPLSIIIGDVNGLKLTNDAFGHKAGDTLLKKVGEIILSSIRGNDIATRWGGDEFAILLPNLDKPNAEKLIRRIQDKIHKVSFEFGSISISFGVDTKLNDKEDINSVFKSAEKLMYHNKLIEVDVVRGKAINAIMNALYNKSDSEQEHSKQVSELSSAIAQEMGLSKAKIKDVKMIGLLHDIGKIGIDNELLMKTEGLSKNERNTIQQHSLFGSRLLNSSHEYARLAAGVLHHHERIDGKGYPNGIKDEQIPIESKIVAVADAYDAMTNDRPYRNAVYSIENAIVELRKHSGTQFDSKVVEIFITKVL